MTNVMKKAWAIARDGQKKFGGKVKEYFSEALKMAWAISRKMKFEVADRRGAWVARITGKHPVYKMNREFINDYEVEGADRVYDLPNGLYHISNGKHKMYFVISGNDYEEVSYADALGMVA